jgi:hypothetical protein
MAEDDGGKAPGCGVEGQIHDIGWRILLPGLERPKKSRYVSPRQ